MICHVCGNPVNPDDHFCTHCGAKIKSIASNTPSVINTTSDNQAESPTASSTACLPPDYETHDSPVPAADDKKAPSRGKGIPEDNSLQKKKIRWLKIALAIITVVAVLCVATSLFIVLHLIGSNPSDTSSSDSGKDVVYYKSDKTVRIRLKSTIVLYNDSGVMDDYDVMTMDSGGHITETHVNGSSFTPKSLNAEEGKSYSVIARDEDGTVREIPHLIIVSTGKTDDRSDNPVHDKLEVRPSPDTEQDDNSNDDGRKDDNRRTAYALYYDKIQELQNQYGKGKIVSFPDSAQYRISGLEEVRLLDFDNDGIEELIIGYRTTSDSTISDGYVPSQPNKVEVYQYDIKNHKINCIYDGFPYTINPEANEYAIIVEQKGNSYTLNGMNILDEENSYGYYGRYLTSATGSKIQQGSYSQEILDPYSDNPSFIYKFNTEEVTEDQYDQELNSLGINPEISESPSSFITDYLSTANRDDGELCKQTLQQTENAIASIKSGLMDGFDGKASPSSDQQSSAYMSYYGKIQELQKRYGTKRYMNEYTDSLKGFCLASLHDFDGDSIDELVTVVSDAGTDDAGTDTGPGIYTVNVWKYNAKSGKLSAVFSGDPGFGDAGYTYIDVRDLDSGEAILYATGYETAYGNFTIFHYSNNNPETLRYERHDASSSDWYLNGTPISAEQMDQSSAQYSSFQNSTKYIITCPRADIGETSPIEQTIHAKDDTIAQLRQSTISSAK